MIKIDVIPQSERLALIKEIARNLVGDAPEPKATTGTAPGLVSSGDWSSAVDDVPDYDRQRQQSAPPNSAAAALAGLRPPSAGLAQSSDYASALARLAQSLAVADGDVLPASVTSGVSVSEAADGSAGTTMQQASAGAAQAGNSSPAAMPTASTAAATAGTMASPDAAESAQSPAGETAASSARSAEGRDAAAVAANQRTAEARAEAARSDAANAARSAGAAAASRADTELAMRSADRTAASAASAASGAAQTETPDGAIERSLLALGLADGAAGAAAAALSSDRASILASFILNAHFQPGWPPVRPIQDAEAKALVQQAAREMKLGKDEIAMLTYLANFGLNRKLIARILKMMAVAENREKLLDAIAAFFANLGALLNTLHEELELLAEELQEARRTDTRRTNLSLR